MLANRILPLLDKVKQTRPNAWMASCPLHSDSHPSLVITETDDKVLLKCFSCHGAAADIVSAVGLSVSDLFPDNPDSDYTPQKRIYFPAKEVLKALEKEAILMSILADKFSRKESLAPDEIKLLKISKARFERGVEYCG